MSKGYKIVDYSKEPIVELSSSASLESYKEIIDRDQPDNDHLSFALTKAVDYGRVDVAELLLNHGADPNYVSGQPISVLAQAGLDSNVQKEIFDLLHQNGANSYDNAMIVAVDNQNNDFIQLLVDNKIDLSNDDFKVLSHAAANNELDIVQTIVSNVDLTQSSIDNAFLEATTYGKIETTDFLINKIDTLDSELKTTVLDNCIYHQENNMVVHLNENHSYSIDRSNNNHLHQALTYGNDQLFEYFVKTEPNLLSVVKDPVLTNRLIMDKPEAFKVLNTALHAQVNKISSKNTGEQKEMNKRVDNNLNH